MDLNLDRRGGVIAFQAFAYTTQVMVQVRNGKLPSCFVITLSKCRLIFESRPAARSTVNLQHSYH